MIQTKKFSEFFKVPHILFIFTLIMCITLTSAFSLGDFFHTGWSKITGKAIIGENGAIATYNYTDGDRELHITYTSGSQSESYKIRLSRFYNDNGVNVTTIELWGDGGWMEKCIDRRPSDYCSVGGAILTIVSISPHPDKTVTVRGSSGVVFSSQALPPQNNPPSTTECIDTDWGKSEFMYGVVTFGKDRLTSGDVCEGGLIGNKGVKVVEKFCNLDGSDGSTLISCQNGCVDGVCKKETGNDATTNVFICSASESEKDYFVKGPQVKHGWKSGSNPSAFSDDYCTSTNILKEVWCENGYYNSYDYPCQNGCVDGACRPEARQESGCIDFDAYLGQDQYYTMSNATSSTESVPDVCFSQTDLVEQICANGKPTPQTYACPNGCKEGRCLSDSDIKQQLQQTQEDTGTSTHISIEDSYGKPLTGTVYLYDKNWVLKEKRETINGAIQFAISQSEEQEEYIITTTAPGYYNETLKVAVKKGERYETEMMLTKCACNGGNCPQQEIICSQPQKKIIKILKIETYIPEQSNLLPLRFRIKISEDLEGVYDGHVVIRHAEKGVISVGNIYCSNLRGKVSIDDCVSYQKNPSMHLIEGEEEYQIEISGISETKDRQRVSIDSKHQLKLVCAREDCIRKGDYISKIEINGHNREKKYPIGTIFFLSQYMHIGDTKGEIDHANLKISSDGITITEDVISCTTIKSQLNLGNDVACYYTWRSNNLQAGEKIYAFQIEASTKEGKTFKKTSELPIKFESIEESLCRELLPNHNKPDANRANIIFIGYGYSTTVDHEACYNAINLYCKSKEHGGGPLKDYVIYDAEKAVFYCISNDKEKEMVSYRDLQTFNAACAIQKNPQIETFKSVVASLVDIEGKNNGLFSVEPFKSNKEKFNFWYADKVPLISEVDCPIDINDPSDILTHCFSKENIESVCKINNKYIIKVIDDTFRASATVDGILLPAPVYDYFDFKNAPRVFVHEIGHALGRLEDEYVVGFREDKILGRSSKRSNCFSGDVSTKSNCLENAPWKNLLGVGCGLEDSIDCKQETDKNYAIEVGCYNECGDIRSFRSVFNSIMRNHYVANPFSFGSWNEKLLKEELDKFSGV